MQMQNKNTIQKFSMLSCLLALVLLLTGLSVSGIFNTKAEESTDTFKLKLSFDYVVSLETNFVIPNGSTDYSLCYYKGDIRGMSADDAEKMRFVMTFLPSINLSDPRSYMDGITAPVDATISVVVIHRIYIEKAFTRSYLSNIIVCTKDKIIESGIDKIPLPPTPTKEGYTFTQWYLDETCTTPYDGREITEDLTLYAGWKINTFTITFDSAGGTAVSTVSAEYNTTITLTTPTREGYNFVGWYNGSTKYNGEPIKDNMTLVAKWQIKTYTVTFMVDGEIYKTLEVNYGTSLSSAMSKADLKYYIPYDSQGVRLSTDEKIIGNTILSVAEMTGEEKVAQFLAANSWILWLSGALIVMLTLSLIFAVKKGKR